VQNVKLEGNALTFDSPMGPDRTAKVALTIVDDNTTSNWPTISPESLIPKAPVSAVDPTGPLGSITKHGPPRSPM
jgi:hypothetical protein